MVNVHGLGQVIMKRKLFKIILFSFTAVKYLLVCDPQLALKRFCNYHLTEGGDWIYGLLGRAQISLISGKCICQN